MFKLVVLSALLAGVVASPDIFTAPLAYRSTVITPGTTTITNQASSVIHPSPVYSTLAYSAFPAYAHLIKKRSAPLLTYVAPSTYVTPGRLATYAAAPWLSTHFAAPLATTYTAPIVHTAPFYSAAHLIKKRSAPFFVPSSYIAPTVYAARPIVSTYALAAPAFSRPIVSSAPFVYTSHVIKKRNAPLVSSYITPTAFSHSSRVDYRSAPLVTYATPLVYSRPLYTHI